MGVPEECKVVIAKIPDYISFLLKSGDNQNFIRFLIEMRAALNLHFEPGKTVISILTTKSVAILESHFDIAGLAEHVDFINSMSYGYYSPSSTSYYTGPLAPLYKSKANETETVHNTMKHLVCRSGNSAKVPFILLPWPMHTIPWLRSTLDCRFTAGALSG